MDDKFHSSEPVKRIPRDIRMAACGLFGVAGTWSADHLKDGFVPEFMLDDWGATVEQAEALVAVKLWRKVRDGYRFTEWAPWQPTRAEVESNRKAERDRKAEYRRRRQESTGSGPGGVPPGQVRDSGVPRPDPTRPDHKTPTESGAAKRGTRLPDGWTPSESLLAAAREYAPSVNLESETANFCDWWRAKAGSGGVKLDWDATWRTWMRRSHDRNVERGWRPADDRPDWMLR
jgi:hypothetical protein